MTFSFVKPRVLSLSLSLSLSVLDFGDRVSLCSPRVSCVDQAGPEILELTLSLPPKRRA